MSQTHWHVLAASAAINWSTYFIHDVPASLSTPLSEHLSLPDHQYAYLVSLLYAVYAVPNTVLPFFAGPAVQRFGERSVLLGTISSIVTGQLLFALSVATKFQPGMIAGRAFIGLGGEMVGVIGCAIVTRWFQGKRFSLALAINLCAGRLGSVANTIVIPRFIGLFGIVPATWIATALSLSVVPISTAFLLSVSRPKKVAVLDESERPLLHKTTDDSSSSSIKDGDKGTRFIITLLPPAFWQLALMCVLSYGCVNTFANSAQRFIASRFYAGDQRAAGSAMSIPYILSGFLVPLFGFVLDKLSSRGYPRALISSNMFLVFGHGIFLLRATASPVLPLCFLGIGDALLCVSFWASVVRCLLQVETGTGTETETIVHAQTPSVQEDNTKRTENDPDKLGCEPILSSRDLDLDLESEEDRAGNAATAHGEVIRTLGIGVMTSLMSVSAAVVPLLLAMMEGAAGLSGLEIVFVVLAALGCLAALRLAWIFH